MAPARTLEANFSDKLQDASTAIIRKSPKFAITRQLSFCGVKSCGVLNGAVANMIEDVVSLAAQLELDTLPNGNVLRQRHVPVVGAWPAISVSARDAWHAGAGDGAGINHADSRAPNGRQCERAGVEELIGRVARSVRIAEEQNSSTVTSTGKV